MGEEPGGGHDRSVPSGPGDTAPTISCSRCDREWTLSFELDELEVGNQAVEQFALDHERHTGHFPDDATPWVTSCRQCPQREAFLAERAARRWATAHSRHTTHVVELLRGDEEPELVDRG